MWPWCATRPARTTRRRPRRSPDWFGRWQRTLTAAPPTAAARWSTVSTGTPPPGNCAVPWRHCLTYGLWIDQARTHLRAAARELSAGSGPETAVDVFAVARGRCSVYRQLHRHVDLLATVAAAPLHTRRTRAVGRPDSAEQMAAAFRDELRNAAGAPDALPPASPTSPAGTSLDAATHCLAIAADVLATHVGPGERPRTPEGAAIRAGGGVPSALADLARVAFDTIHIDLALPNWIDTADDRHRAIGEQLAAASRQATTGELPSLLRDFIAAAPAGPSLLHGLDVAPVANPVKADVRTIDDAVASLRAVRTWLWQNPTQHHGTHLRLGTQLGLAVTLLAGEDPADHTSAARTWRRAASVAADVEGSAPTGEAEPIADTLAGVLRWTRKALDGNERPQAGALTAQRPALAEALFAGVAAPFAFQRRPRPPRVRAAVAPTSTRRHGRPARRRLTSVLGPARPGFSP